jgi:hypothetical protein
MNSTCVVKEDSIFLPEEIPPVEKTVYQTPAKTHPEVLAFPRASSSQLCSQEPVKIHSTMEL